MKLEIKDWQVRGFWQNELPPVGFNPIYTLGVTDWLPAEVPGSVHQALQNAGIIKDPNVDRNSLDCEWVENKWWFYRTSVTVPETKEDEVVLLDLTGVDYAATVLVGGVQVGEVCGMYRTHTLDITKYVKPGEAVEIGVVIHDAPRDIATYGHTEFSNTQKSRFNYKWDFSTRLVNLGLYDRVFLQTTSCRITDWHVKPILTGRNMREGIVDVTMEIESYCEQSITAVVNFDGNATEHYYYLRKGANTVTFQLDAGIPELWWPNGHGAQKLYPLSVTLTKNDVECDSRSLDIGFRTLSYVHTEGACAEAIPYNAVINGKKIFLKGVNFVPLDLQYGAVTEERYEKMLTAVRDANVTIIRVWGGGMIEKEYFYSLCDRFGIMIWQDFIQSSSGGFSDFPGKTPEFMELMEKTATFAVKQKRNHVCLTYWCGGNELTDDRYPGHERRPVTYDDKNIAMLKRVVETYDPGRLFLPSSASGPHELLNFGMGKEAHDIHGPWTYMGFVDHYRLMNESESMLHSEMGTDGMSCLESIKKFISPEHIGAYTAGDDPVWKFHAAWDTYGNREFPLLGKFEHSELEDLIACSQFFQAEGVRYLIESNRRRCFANCGSIIWQFNEPWANVGCTNLVDYYGEKKMAYYTVANSYRPLLVSARYDRMSYVGGEDATMGIFLTNENLTGEYTAHAELRRIDGELLAAQDFAGAAVYNSTVKCGELTATMPADCGGVVLTVTAKVGDETAQNSYLFLREVEGRADRAIILQYLKNC